MMFTITSDTFEFEGKKKGAPVAEKELLEAGLNIEALVAGAHLSSNAAKSVQVEGAAE